MQYYSSQGKPLDLTLGSFLNIQGNDNRRDIRVARLAGRFVVAHMKRPGCWIDCRRVPNSRCINAKREDGSLVVVGYWEEYAKSKVYPLPKVYHTEAGFSCVAGRKIMPSAASEDATHEVALMIGNPGKSEEQYVIRILSQKSMEEMQRRIEESGGYLTDGIDKRYKLYDDAGNYVGYLMRCYYMDDHKGGKGHKSGKGGKGGKGRRRIIEAQFVNGGGQGSVYQLDGASEFTESHQYVVKVYNNPDAINVDKLTRLKEIFDKNEGRRSGICYPRFLVYDKPKGGRCVGILMLECERGDTLYNIVSSIQNLRNRNWTRAELVTMAIDILERFEAIHRMGLLMGDVNLNNILVTVNRSSRMPVPVVIDVDSFQIGDDEKYLCPVFRNEFLSPRLQMQSSKSRLRRTLNDEYYAIAVLLFNILFLGRHPYETSRTQCIETQLKASDFLFPLSYEQDRDVLGGAYLRIWRSLSEGLRVAFHKTFFEAYKEPSREFLSPMEWIELLKEYQDMISRNILPRTIYPSNPFLLKSYISRFEVDSRNFADDAQYGCYLNELAKSDGGDNCAIIELGTTWMSLFTPNGTSSSKPQEMLRNYVYCIKPDGTLDIEKFVKNTDAHWQEFNRLVVGLRPRITKLYTYSGSFLRNIKNRDEVIATIKERWGVNIGVLSVAKEVDMLFGTQGGKGKKGAMAVNIGYTSTLLATRQGGSTQIFELGDLGLAVLRNLIFGTSMKDVTRTDVQFAQIDREIEERLQRIELPEIKRAFVVVKGRKINGKSLSDETIEAEFEELSKDLLTNRTYVSALYEDVESTRNQQLPKSVFSKFGRRLELSIYLALMRKLGLESLEELVCVYEGMIDDVVNIK